MAEKKEYRSAIRSRKMIHQAFIELLREKSFERITVTDIVKQADINRSTFYAHYPDVRGLVEAIIQKTLDDSLELVQNTTFHDIFTDPGPFLEKMISIGMEYEEIYRLIGNTDFALRQVENIKAILLEKATSTIDIPEHIRHSKAFRIRVGFFVGGILNIFQLSMTGNLDCSTDEIKEQLANLILSNADLYRNWESNDRSV